MCVQNAESGKKEIYRQLDTLMASELFKSSKVLSGMLKFVVKETVEGREGQIKGYTIAVAALGCKKEVQAQDLAMVRIYAGRLRKLLDKYYSVNHEEDCVLINIPKGCYKPSFISLQKVYVAFILLCLI